MTAPVEVVLRSRITDRAFRVIKGQVYRATSPHGALRIVLWTGTGPDDYCPVAPDEVEAVDDAGRELLRRLVAR